MQHQAHSNALQVLLQQPAGSVRLSAAEEQALVCSLLCCSQALGQVVHSTCSGRLQGRLPRSSQAAPAQQQQQQQQSQSRAVAYCRWLAKHACLLHSLQLSISATEESAVAAGLKQAAAAATAQQQKKAPKTQQLQPRVTRSRAAAAAAAAAAAGPVAAAAVDFTALAMQAAAAGVALSAAEGPLPLAELCCCSPIQGSLLHSLAGSQLSRLQLTLAPGAARLTALAAGLASLTGLRQLSLAATAAPDGGAPWTTAAHVASVVAGLSRLSQLTQLQLSGWVLLGPADAKQLPRGLASLSIARRMAYGGGPADEPEIDGDFPDDLEQPPSPLDLAHLTSLTRLEVFELCPGDQLPPNLLQLRLDCPYDLTAIANLQKLQLLTIEDAICTNDGFGLPPGRLPASVTEVQLSLTNPMGTYYFGGEFTPWPGRKLDYFADQITSIRQLRRLHLDSYILQPGLLSHLGRCSQLTSLVLCDCALSRSDECWQGLEWSKAELVNQIRGLAAQLCKLQTLQHLELDLAAEVTPDEEFRWREENGLTEFSSDGDGEPEQRHTDGDNGGISGVCAADLEPLVDAICGLSLGLRSLRVEWRCKGYAQYGQGTPVLSAEQQARLAAVAPPPPQLLEPASDVH